MLSAQTPSHTGVKVTNEESDRAGQVGFTLGMALTPEGHPSDDFMRVKFDGRMVDGQLVDAGEEDVPLADLVRL